MTVDLTDIERWDPRTVGQIADAAERWAEATAEATAALAVIGDIGWRGVASTAAREAILRTRIGMDLHAEEAGALARAARAAADRIAEVKARAGSARDDDRIVAEATAVDDELARAVAMSIGAPGPRPFTPPPVPAAGSAPTDVRRWWQSLGADQRVELLATRAVELGNLDGIPVADRDRANRAVLTGDLSPAAVEVREALELNAMRTGAEVLLLIYQPSAFGGQGRAAVAIGNPDTAAHTAVMVPGTGNSVSSGWLDDMSISNLYNEMTVAVPGSAGPMSVVAWMGYDAPDSLLDPRVAATGLARRGGAVLAGDLRALAVTAQRDSHTTVIGHSYGSTTVANAAAGYGMPTDDVVLVGSPGTDLAGTAADFGLPDGGRVYVGAASGDPVTFLAGAPPAGPVGLGPDPAAAGFGSTRFKAEFPGLGWKVWEDHVRYFESGSESMFTIAGVAAGDSALLADHGMTAPPRGGAAARLAPALGLPNWSRPWTDPELLRPATSGHFHWER